MLALLTKNWISLIIRGTLAQICAKRGKKPAVTENGCYLTCDPELIRGVVFYWGRLMAAALVGSMPVAIIYAFSVDRYVAGVTAGSAKS